MDMYRNQYKITSEGKIYERDGSALFYVGQPSDNAQASVDWLEAMSLI